MDNVSNLSTIRVGRSADPFVKTPEWIILSGISPQAQALYTVLRAHVNNSRGDGVAWPGQEVLAVLLGFKHRNSVTRYTNELIGIGAVDVERVQNSTFRHNVYLINELPPEEHVGHRSLAEFYAALESRRSTPTHTGVGVAGHTEVGVAGPTGVGNNQTNATTGSEADEDAYQRDAASGAPSGSKMSRQLYIRRAYWTMDDGHAAQYLVATALSKLKKLGLVPDAAAGDAIGTALKHKLQFAPRKEWVRNTQRWVNEAGTDASAGWIAA